MFRHHKSERKLEIPKNHVEIPITHFDPPVISSEAALKQFNEVIIPNSFLDPLSFKPFVDPVITPQGHVYSCLSILRHLSEVAVDPLSQLPLTQGQLHQAPQEILAILKRFKALQSDTEKSIMHDPVSVTAILENYQKKLLFLNMEMEAVLQKQITQGTIKTIKNNLKIDSNNKDHINFWQSKGKSGNTTPDHVRNMMKVAKDHYDSVEDFLDAINHERRLSASSKFFKHCFRSNTTIDLYNQSDENIKSFVVRD